VVAQTPVFSVNAVGYVNVTVPAGAFALLANPLNASSNVASAVLPDVPANTVVYIFNSDTAAFTQITKRAGTLWTGGTLAGNTPLAPGQGFFIKAPTGTAVPITFVGEVPQGTNLTVNIPAAGFHLLGSIVPQEGGVQSVLGLPAVNGDVVYTFNPDTQGYSQNTKRAGTLWTPSEPVIAVGRGFFLKATAAGTWTRSFSVNQ
jgi:hypothetical protein